MLPADGTPAGGTRPTALRREARTQWHVICNLFRVTIFNETSRKETWVEDAAA